MDRARADHKSQLSRDLELAQHGLALLTMAQLAEGRVSRSDSNPGHLTEKAMESIINALWKMRFRDWELLCSELAGDHGAALRFAEAVRTMRMIKLKQSEQPGAPPFMMMHSLKAKSSHAQAIAEGVLRLAQRRGNLLPCDAAGMEIEGYPWSPSTGHATPRSRSIHQMITYGRRAELMHRKMPEGPYTLSDTEAAVGRDLSDILHGRSVGFKLLGIMLKQLERPPESHAATSQHLLEGWKAMASNLLLRPPSPAGWHRVKVAMAQLELPLHIDRNDPQLEMAIQAWGMATLDDEPGALIAQRCRSWCRLGKEGAAAEGGAAARTWLQGRMMNSMGMCCPSSPRALGEHLLNMQRTAIISGAEGWPKQLPIP